MAGPTAPESAFSEEVPLAKANAILEFTRAGELDAARETYAELATWVAAREGKPGHEHFVETQADAGLELVKALTEAKTFEPAIGVLETLAGFAHAHLGDKRIHDRIAWLSFGVEKLLRSADAPTDVLDLYGRFAQLSEAFPRLPTTRWMRTRLAELMIVRLEDEDYCPEALELMAALADFLAADTWGRRSGGTEDRKLNRADEDEVSALGHCYMGASMAGARTAQWAPASRYYESLRELEAGHPGRMELQRLCVATGATLGLHYLSAWEGAEAGRLLGELACRKTSWGEVEEVAPGYDWIEERLVASLEEKPDGPLWEEFLAAALETALQDPDEETRVGAIFWLVDQIGKAVAVLGDLRLGYAVHARLAGMTGKRPDEDAVAAAGALMQFILIGLTDELLGRPTARARFEEACRQPGFADLPLVSELGERLYGKQKLSWPRRRR